MVTDAGHHSAAGGSRIERHIFSNRIVVSDDQFAGLSPVLEILGPRSDGRELIDRVALAERSASLNHHMRRHPGFFANPYPGSDNTVGADFNLRIYFRLAIDHSRLMDRGH